MTEYKLVPVKPTPEMMEAGAEWCGQGLGTDEAKGRAAVAYRSMLAAAPAVQGEPVGYVSPRLLDALRSGKACGITMEDKPDAHNGVTIPLCTAPQPTVQREPVDELRFEYRHPKTGKAYTVSLSREEVMERMDEELFEKLTACFCECEPIGETNDVHCRCDEYADQFELVTTTQPVEQQSVLNLSEAARCLGVAQEKGDQGAIEYWGAMVACFERVLIQSADKQENVSGEWRSRFLKFMGEIQSELDESNEDPIPSELWSLWRELLDTAPQPVEQQSELAAPAVQGEPVGYVRPHHLEMLLSGKVCGVTMEDRPDERNGVTVPLYAAQQPAPDVKALVEALECFAEWYEQVNLRNEPRFQFYDKAKKALAAFRKQGGEV